MRSRASYFFVTGMAPSAPVLQVQAWLAAQAARFRLRRDAVFAGLPPPAAPSSPSPSSFPSPALRVNNP
jgi:hypothetical protein